MGSGQPRYRRGKLGLGPGEGPDRCLLCVRAATAAGARSSRFLARAAILRALRRGPCTPAGATFAACRCGAPSSTNRRCHHGLIWCLSPLFCAHRSTAAPTPDFQALALSSPGERACAPSAALATAGANLSLGVWSRGPGTWLAGGTENEVPLRNAIMPSPPKGLNSTS